MKDDLRPLVVTIQCFTYNHEPYIRQCLEGFVMQKTNFRFEAIIHDDASTDGTANIVREFSENYPNIIKPIFEKENQYSKGDGSLSRIMKEHTYGKYVACCEGDDYWTDPLKLQKQVDYMESNSECTMTCSRAMWFSVRKNNFIAEQYCLNKDGLVSPADIINRTGYFIPTCSIVYRPQILDDYPDYCQNCPVGDWPLQITAAMKGPVFYFNDIMCVYRVENDSSWTSMQKCNSVDSERLHVIRCLIDMFDGFSKDYPLYRIVFIDKIAEFICKNVPRWIYGKEELKIYEANFSNEISQFSFKWKFFYKICLLRIPVIKYWYRRIFLHRYFMKMKYYK